MGNEEESKDLLKEREPVLFRLIDNLEEAVVVLFLAAMTVVVFLQVIFRFVLKGSLPWSEEVSRYLMVWVTFIGASIGVKHGAHIGVEAFVKLLPAALRRGAAILAGFLSLLFLAIVFYNSTRLIQFLWSSGQLSPAMQIPMFWAYLAVPVGTVLMGIRFAQTLYKEFASKKTAGIPQVPAAEGGRRA